MTFSIKEGSFFLNDRKVFLNSGEIHYFRIRRELWDKHLKAAREAGLTTVSSYVPWAWHESVESVFDFEGASFPECDLKGWLELCRSHGLTCILKPGPFILAESRGAGLPEWFLNKYHDDVWMRNSKGEAVLSDGVSLFNRKYLEKVTLWYDKIIPFISGYQISAGGPVIMMQVCNEIGVFTWLAHQGDYGGEVKQRFIAWLAGKFKDIVTVNSLWGVNYTDFSEVELPPDGSLPYRSKGDRSRDYEWHCFWRTYYGDYLRMLTGMIRERGVTLPLFHNLPGWIYGHGYEFPVNITMYQDLFGERSEIVFGVDHIPEFISYRNMHDDRIINDITQAVQGNKPLFAAEFQSGSREYHVVTNPREMELFYKASIANGLTGWNYYMFSQGRNPRKRGHSGETFYWFTPLTAEGERTSAFPVIRRMSRIVKTAESLIVNAHRRAEVCVLFYPPYYATELEKPVDSACDLQFIPSAIRRPAWFDGLLKALQVLGIEYDMTDLTRTTADTLGRYKQVWAFCTDEINAVDQQTIVDYTANGGITVIFPSLPDREMSQRPCTVIRDALSVSPSGMENIESPLIDLYDLKDIKCTNPQITFAKGSLSGKEVIARTVSGTACGFAGELGRGSVIYLGTWMGFDTEGQKPAYEEILKKSGAKLRHTTSDNAGITVRERFTDSGAAIVFVGNYFNEAQTGKVYYTHPVTREIIAVPYAYDEILWPPLYGVLTPVCLDVSDGLKILHSTSDILSVEAKDGGLEITLSGDRDLAGETVFEGVNISRIRSATISGNPVRMISVNNRIAFTYSHLHNKEFMLDIKTD